MESSDELKEVLQRLTRVETKIDMMITARDIAIEAQQSSKAAHRRLDSVEANQTWLWRTVIGALLLGAIGLLFFYLQK